MNELVNSRLSIKILTKLAYAALMLIVLSVAAFYLYFLISTASSTSMFITSMTLAVAVYVTLKNAVRVMLAPAVSRVRR